ncbi:MAG: CoA pyrophosphatase, partial [Candidatus Competibacterales bacterium]|nr:CoA pyrophosphatase [Candidatus Competibacterales bacterium]
MLSIEHVRARLRRPLPGHAAQALMMPRPRGGRLPARGRLRNAGVLILLFPRDETELALVLIRRAAHADRPDPHSGQLALPGGRQETGESLSATALRETAEEVGVDRCRIRLLAALTPLEIPVSGHRVQPFIGYCAPTPRFRPDPSEVAGIVQWPLHRLLDG